MSGELADIAERQAVALESLVNQVAILGLQARRPHWTQAVLAILLLCMGILIGVGISG